MHAAAAWEATPWLRLPSCSWRKMPDAHSGRKKTGLLLARPHPGWQLRLQPPVSLSGLLSPFLFALLLCPSSLFHTLSFVFLFLILLHCRSPTSSDSGAHAATAAGALDPYEFSHIGTCRRRRGVVQCVEGVCMSTCLANPICAYLLDD